MTLFLFSKKKQQKKIEQRTIVEEKQKKIEQKMTKKNSLFLFRDFEKKRKKRLYRKNFI